MAPDPTSNTLNERLAPMTLARNRTFTVLVVLGLAAALAISTLSGVDASSHREAPLITEDPVADNTDTYAFVSPDAPDTVTLVANYNPLQQPAGGPNFYNFGDDVLYSIHVDNDGDAVADITYEWRFTTEIQDPNTFLYATGTIASLDDPAFNLRQTYTLSAVVDGQRTVLGQNLPVPPNNLGPRSTPNYASLAAEAITDLPGGVTAFAGQRDDPFWVDLGSIFDLGGLRPFNDIHVAPLPVEDGVDAVAGKNTLSLVLRVPTDALTQSSDQPVIGVWATSARRKVRTFAGGSAASPVHAGPFTQVSRLGMPLVNEVVIPLGLKDVFNTLSPSQDAGALAGVEAGSSTEGDIPIVEDPELADLIPVLYPGVEVPAPPRADLVQVFLTGVPDLNQFPAGFQPAEYIRLNTSIAPAGSSPNAGERLGVLAGDTAGYPNGRRLIDDTVDISLQVVAGILVNPDTPPLTDGVLTNDVPFLDGFPYLAHPHGGYEMPQLQ